ncbi:enoyl-CoA hydratase/isomerase family protein [Bordetella petrii]|uniref:enoyl-CoA hydratase/isomerase family protein n=1 Tax=Bordetella petrii TaxID=94624 RepID=UPI001E3F6B73|nr:enoyl-CoA hydratase/isomerase family protein [Bordetella petrii]MCD0505800.1 enoyl-CoA hydratase/isomerase family protein [Bordetella petrii]
MLQTLEVAYGPQTAVVWLARPDVRNALDSRLIAELTETFMALADDSSVRAIVLAGRGKAFCAGADLNAMRASAQATQDENRADAQAMSTLLHTVYTCPKPTIARIHGPCMAGGMGLATACDIAVAAREARFALTETRLGLIPAMISPYVLRAMGARAASRWFLSAEVFDAAEAWRMGLVHELCEADELDARINALLGSFMLASPHALAESKRLIRDVAGRDIEASLLDETAARLAAQRATEDGREGIAAFLEKRAPRWVPELPDAE